jgi:hypothetical protein
MTSQLHLRVCDHIIDDFGGCLGTTFGHFLLGSHNHMVTALGSCVEVALIPAFDVFLEGVLGRPLDTFFWAPTISWSQLLARVWKWP